MNINYLVIISLNLLFFSCNTPITEENSKQQNDTISMSFQTLTSEKTGINFTNTISETEDFNFFNYEYIYNGGGIAVGDINNDGLIDIYFSGNQVSDKLYLNKGNMTFEDITPSAIGNTASEGWHTGVSMVDVNQDGWLDIYVCRSGIPSDTNLLGNLLYINNKDNTFSEKSTFYGIDIKRKTTQSAFIDFDNDGDLDLYVMNHPNQSDNKTSVGAINDLIKKGSPDSDMFLENVDGVFKDVSRQVGINNHAYGLGITVSDINNDGYPDIYISNDYMAPDFMYINKGNGTFIDESKKQLKHMSNYAMGNDIADFNNDGFLDIMTVDMVSEDHVRSKKNMGGMSTKKFWEAVSVGYHYQYMYNSLQMNNGNETFSEIAQMAGISKTDWSWAPLFADFDNDGYKDLFISNGYRRDSRDNDYMKETNNPKNKNLNFQQKLDLIPATKVQNYIFKNTGDLHFDKKMKKWNINTATNSNGAVYADLDNDGDLDLITNNMEEVSTISQNKLNSTNLYLDLQLTKNSSPAMGAKVKVQFSDYTIQYLELQTTRGYLSSVSPILHLGYKPTNNIKEISIEWTDNTITTLNSLKSNQLLKIEFNTATKIAKNANSTSKQLFTKVENKITVKHQELFVNDFKKEVLLPNKMSQLGPFISSGDVNNDGLDDIYISGSRTFSGQLLLQNKNGEFKKTSGPWEQQKQREEMDSELFDIDNDGDLDLYVISGGNEYDINSKNLHDQLYINDGKGNFKNESFRLPPMKTSGQRLAVGDIDNDGDLDIFIGGRQTPGYYPFPPRSYLLQNNDGYFTDITQNSNDIMGPGLITQSIFDDFDQDGDLDLICVGEWMPVSFFENNKGQFTNVTQKHGNPKAIGWWSSITKGDFNGDGKNDYIIGNLGLNNKFHPSTKFPLEIYCHDFDNSGSYDIVLGKYQNETCYPVRGKQCSSEQMPFVSEKFPTYDAFAVANLENIYGKEQLNQALHFSATTFNSVILLSQPKTFISQNLNNYTQTSCINAGVAIDINKDGFLDFIGIGNNYAAEVETIRYDAGTGVVLLGNGKGNFKVAPTHVSGFFSNTDDKDLLTIKNNLFISANNSPLKQFKY